MNYESVSDQLADIDNPSAVIQMMHKDDLVTARFFLPSGAEERQMSGLMTVREAAGRAHRMLDERGLNLEVTLSLEPGVEIENVWDVISVAYWSESDESPFPAIVMWVGECRPVEAWNDDYIPFYDLEPLIHAFNPHPLVKPELQYRPAEAWDDE